MEQPPAMTALNVQSEVGRLRRVILHRPDLELRRLTPSNAGELLFDDILWVEEARRQHDAFAEALRSAGVEVLSFEELMVETMALPEARAWVMDREVGEDDIGAASHDVRELLDDMDPATLVRHLIGGLTSEEARIESGESLWLQSMAADEFVLRPLPNSYFMRDSSAWLYGGVMISRMGHAARVRETNHTEVVFRHHPLFAGSGVEFWKSSEAATPGTIEGGDVLVIGHGAVLCGVSGRTSAPAVEALARTLFEAERADRLIAVELPHQRSFIHLDTVCTMVDPETFMVFPGVLDDARVWTITPGNSRSGLHVTPEDSFEKAVAGALGLTSLRFVVTGGTEQQARREQWDDGNNLLAVAPGVVIGYDRTVRSNAALRKAGIEVILIPGSELSRGRGGPRCMSCPIERDPT